MCKAHTAPDVFALCRRELGSLVRVSHILQHLGLVRARGCEMQERKSEMEEVIGDEREKREEEKDEQADR